MATTTTPMTFAEFEQLPDEPAKLELLEGELIRMPPPKKKHMTTSQRLFLALLKAAEGLRGSRPQLALGDVHHEMGYLLGTDPGTWLVPDVSMTHRNQKGEDYYEGAPLIAIEVASESQSAPYLEAKAQTYLSHGAQEVWLVYPKTQHVWVYRTGSSTMERQEHAIRSEVLPGVELRFEEIF
jgi:Uma2 family endonuclease